MSTEVKSSWKSMEKLVLHKNKIIYKLRDENELLKNAIKDLHDSNSLRSCNNGDKVVNEMQYKLLNDIMKKCNIK